LHHKLKIGLIGCGRAAELIYLPALKKFTSVEVTVVIDPLEERRDLIGKHYPACSKYSELNASIINKIDAGIVLTPPDTHITLASQLLKKNKYVLVEKPLSDSMGGIKNLFEDKLSSKASLMMGFNHRHWQPIVALKEKLSENTKIESAEITFTVNNKKWLPVSFNSNPIDNLGPHVFDLIRYLFKKEIISISAKSFDENNIDLKIKMQGGITVRSAIAHSDKTLKIIKVITEAEKYCLSLPSIRIKPEPGGRRSLYDLKDRIERKLLRKTSPIKNTYVQQLNNFFSFVRDNKEANPGIKDGTAAILAVVASQKSINRKGKEIFLNEI
jgi:predicted dehydrogenase